MADYISIILASVPASIGVGIGIAFGQDVYKYFKEKIQKHRDKLQEGIKNLRNDRREP
jgi:hypothetical protein